MITNFLSSLVGGFGRLIMQWSSFYGTMFGSLFGIVLLVMTFTTGMSAIEYSYHWLMGNQMYDFWMEDREKDVMGGVNISNEVVYYGGTSRDQITASYDVENTLPYAVRNIMIRCAVYDTFDRKTVLVSFASGTIAANSTVRVSTKSAEGLHYIGPFSDLGNCILMTGKQADPWRKPIRGVPRRW